MALGFFSRLKEGLSRSTQKLTGNITQVFNKRRLDEEALEELEDMLIAGDLGPDVAERVIEEFRRSRFGREVTDEEVKQTLAEEIAKILDPVAHPLVIDRALKPHVVLVVGVNGTGKTTTIGKLALQYREQGMRAMMVAGDTFRAAAVEQLQIWGERTGAPVIAGPPNSDAAGLAFDALTRAKAEGADVLLVDTAGRLHNKAALMEELRKIIRVMQKRDPTAPHSVLLVLDATTGQNALEQVRIFKEMVNVTGLVVTKLDGSARGRRGRRPGRSVRPAGSRRRRRRAGRRSPPLHRDRLRQGPRRRRLTSTISNQIARRIHPAGGGSKNTSCSPANRITSPGSGTLLIFSNNCQSFAVGVTQNRHVTSDWLLLKMPCGMPRTSRMRSPASAVAGLPSSSRSKWPDST